MSKKVLILVWGGVLIIAIVVGLVWWQGQKVKTESVSPIIKNQETSQPAATAVPSEAPQEIIEEEETIE